MDITGKSKAELSDQLITLASSLKDEDLENPETFGMVSQLLNVLDPAPDQMPKELVERLQQMNDPKERLMEAALATGASDADSLGNLVESMKSQGLMKEEFFGENLLHSYREHIEDLNKGAPKLGEGVHASYSNAAHSSANVMFRAKIKGQERLSETIPLHASLKVFHKPEDMPLEEVKNVVKNLNIKRPNPSKLHFRTSIFNSPRTGQNYYMLHMHGTDPEYEKLADHFKGQGISHDKFMAHVTIDKHLYERINKEGLKPHEIEFSPLMIEHGADNPIHIFEDDHSKDDHKRSFIPKLAPQASESFPETKMKKTDDKKSIEDLKKAASALLEKRSKNVRRELARINSGKAGEQKTVAREAQYMKDKVAVDQTHSLPSEGDLAEKHFGDRKATDKVTAKHKRAAGWKDNANGEPIRKPEITYKKGKQKVTHMPTPKSVRHEHAHALRTDSSLHELGAIMQPGYGKVKSAGAKAEKEAGEKAKAAGADAAGIKAAKTKGAMKGNPHAWQGEYETNGTENLIARRTGSLPPRNTASRTIATDVAAHGKGPKDERDALQVGMNGAKKDQPIHKLVPAHTSMESSVVRRDREAKQRKASTPKHEKAVKQARAAGKPDPAKMPEKGPAKMVHIASLTENVRPHIKDKVKAKLDEGTIKYDKKTKRPAPATNVDAKINARAAEATKQAKAPPQANESVTNPHITSAKPKQQKEEKLAASEAASKGLSYRQMWKAENKK